VASVSAPHRIGGAAGAAALGRRRQPVRLMTAALSLGTLWIFPSCRRLELPRRRRARTRPYDSGCWCAADVREDRAPALRDLPDLLVRATAGRQHLRDRRGRPSARVGGAPALLHLSGRVRGPVSSSAALTCGTGKLSLLGRRGRYVVVFCGTRGRPRLLRLPPAVGAAGFALGARLSCRRSSTPTWRSTGPSATEYVGREWPVARYQTIFSLEAGKRRDAVGGAAISPASL